MKWDGDEDEEQMMINMKIEKDDMKWDQDEYEEI